MQEYKKQIESTFNSLNGRFESLTGIGKSEWIKVEDVVLRCLPPENEKHLLKKMTLKLYGDSIFNSAPIDGEKVAKKVSNRSNVNNCT